MNVLRNRTGVPLTSAGRYFQLRAARTTIASKAEFID